MTDPPAGVGFAAQRLPGWFAGAWLTAWRGALLLSGVAAGAEFLRHDNRSGEEHQAEKKHL